MTGPPPAIGTEGKEGVQCRLVEEGSYGDPAQTLRALQLLMAALVF